MKRVLYLFFLIFVIGFLCSVNVVLADSISLSSCGSLDQANTTYLLSNDVSDYNSCFTFYADNITLDCQGNMINFGRYGYYQNGIVVNSYSNPTIKNCRIVQDSYPYGQRGIFITNSQNVTLLNNSISLATIYSKGIDFQGSAHGLIKDNLITLPGDRGISESSSSDLLFSHNIIQLTNWGSLNFGFDLYAGQNNSFDSNIINTSTQDVNNYGFNFVAESNSFLTNNTLNIPNGPAIHFEHGWSLENYRHVIDTSNTKFGKPIYYLFGRSDETISNLDVGQLFIINSSNVTVTNITSTIDGLYFLWAQDSKLVNSHVHTSGLNNLGIDIELGSNNIISNNIVDTASDSSSGLSLFGTSNNRFSNNTIYTSGVQSYGAHFDQSKNSTFTNNLFNVSAAAIFIEPTSYEPLFFSQVIDTSNTKFGKPIFYYFGNASISISNLYDVGQLFVANSTEVTIKDITSNTDGITLAWVTNSSIRNVSISTSDQYDHGIYLQSRSSGNVLSNNNITVKGNQANDLYFYLSSVYNIVFNNTLLTDAYNARGISVLGDSDNNSFIENNIETLQSGSLGVYLESSESTLLLRNVIATFSSNSPDLNLYDSHYSSFSSNNLSTYGDYSRGITLSYDNNLTFFNNSMSTVGYNSEGINNYYSSMVMVNNTLTTLGNYAYGIDFGNPLYSILTGNAINAENAQALYFSPRIVASDYDHYIDASNTKFGKPIYYFFGNSSITISNLYDIGQVYVANAFNITLINITGLNNTDGITFALTTDSQIINCSLKTTAYQDFGVWLQSNSQNNLLMGNTIVTSGQQAHGIYLSDGSNNNDLLLNNVVTLLGDGARGVYLYAGSSYSSIIGNTFTVNSSNTEGINVYGGSYNNITNNTIFIGKEYSEGIKLYSTSNNKIQDNNITGLDVYNPRDITLTASSYNSVVNNTLTTLGSQGYGIELYSSSSNNLIQGNILHLASGSGGFGIRLYWYSDNNNVSNNIIQGSGDGLYLEQGSHNSFTNNLVSNADHGIRLEQASNNFFNNDSTYGNTQGMILGSSLTSGNVFTDLFACYNREYDLVENGQLGNIFNRSIYTTALLSNLSFPAYFDQISTCPFISGMCSQTLISDVALSQDILSCDSDGIIIGADNIVLDCAGHMLSGKGDDSPYAGIWLNGHNNVTIKNCQVEDFGNGLFINPSGDNNTLINNTLIQNNYGVSVSSGTGNNFSDTFSCYNTAYDLSESVFGANSFFNSIYRSSSQENASYFGQTSVCPFRKGVCGQTVLDNTVLDADILNCSSDGINIGVPNLVLDCAGHTITGFYTGVHSVFSNTTVKNCTLFGFTHGIRFVNASDGHILYNTLEGNLFGIYLDIDSNNNNLSSNHFVGNDIGIYLNYADSNELGFNLIENTTSLPLGDASGAIVLLHSPGTLVHDNTLLDGIDNSSGLSILDESSSSSLLHNLIANFPIGILVNSSSNLKISSNYVENTSYGVSLYEGGNSLFSNNSLINSIQASLFVDSSNNIFFENIFLGNVWVEDYGTGNVYNDYARGNRYYLADGSKASSVYNILDNNLDGWAETGTSLPFNSEIVSGHWIGNGQDAHPATEDLADMNSPNVSIRVLNSQTNINVTYGKWFNVTLNVSCSGYHCGNVSVVLDPSDSKIFNFTTCGVATGRTGPIQEQCDEEYTSTLLHGLVTVENGIQYWTVPATGKYVIEAWGAGGGVGNNGRMPGKGAFMHGEYTLQAGTVLKILVGQKPNPQGSQGYGVGGGGGSFVAKEDNTPLIVAGGGGSSASYNDYNGTDASISTTGTDGNPGWLGGSDGAGGIGSGGGWGGAGGAGFYGDGGVGFETTTVAQSFINGGYGGAGYDPDGGFGGGGAGGGGAGGGGGYSGGGAGYDYSASGGGGSYNNGTNQINIPGVNLENGGVSITQSEKGIISTSDSATPFWTNASANPAILPLLENQSELLTFWVQATGDGDTTHTFFAYADQGDVFPIHTTSESWNVTIEPLAVLGITLINPELNLSVIKSYDFNVTAQVCCSVRTCGEFNVTLINNGEVLTNSSNPFSTLTNNPSTFTLDVGQCENMTWQVNPLGDFGSLGTFAVLANATWDSAIYAISSILNVSITHLPSQVSLDVITPLGNMNVTKGKWFNVTLNVSCTGYDCGNVNISLDPISACDPAAEICTDSCVQAFNEGYAETGDWYDSSGYCSDDYNSYIESSEVCDLSNVSSDGPGTCAKYHDNGESVNYYCPSFDRVGHAVTSDDCTCDTEGCSLSNAEIFNLSNPYFTGASLGTYFGKSNYPQYPACRENGECDCLTPTLCISRGTERGLYNAYSEKQPIGGDTHAISPLGSEWVRGTCANPQPSWGSWYTVAGPRAFDRNIDQMKAATFCMHLISDNLSYTVRINNWSVNSGTDFGYTRTNDSGSVTFEKGGIYPGCIAAGTCDCISPTVCLARSSTRGLFNAYSEFYSDGRSTSGNSPAGTAWARGTCDSPTTSFGTWNAIASPQAFSRDFTTMYATPLCVHLLDDDTYIDLRFTNWGSGGSGGGFSYERNNGSGVYTFEKSFNSSTCLAEGTCDCLTSNVCITRGSSRGLYNPVTQSSYSGDGPADTEWRIGSCEDPAQFGAWGKIASPYSFGQDLDAMLASSFCVRSNVENATFDLQLTSWTSNGDGGGFSYVRTNSSGNTVNFTRPDLTYASYPSYPACKDEGTCNCISPTVCLTRGNSRGLYNAYSESEPDYDTDSSGSGGSSPAGTEWAAGSCASNPEFSTWSNVAAPRRFGDTVDEMLATPFCVHLLDDNSYYDLKFNSWGQDDGGSFSYYLKRFGGVKGLISTSEGATPFWTNASANPAIFSLLENQSELLTFWVQATGDGDTTHTFFAYADWTDLGANHYETGKWNVSIEPLAVLAIAPLNQVSEIIQNQTFNVSARVCCSVRNCGETNLSLNVNGTLLMAEGNPFYTMTSNPSTLENLTLGQCENVSWEINATGDPDTLLSFFIQANATQDPDISATSTSWDVTIVRAPVPHLSLEVVYPLQDLNVSKNQFFNVTLNVSCTNADCGEVNVSLDPVGSVYFTKINSSSEDCITSQVCLRRGSSGVLYNSVVESSADNAVSPQDTEWALGTCAAHGTFGTFLNAACNGQCGTFILNKDLCAHLISDDVYVDVYFVNYSSGPQGAIFSYYRSEPASQFTKGLISAIPGTLPFWTNESNPRTISLGASESMLVTFSVNATGSAGNRYLFYAYANMTSDMSINNLSLFWNVSIFDTTSTLPPLVTLNSPAQGYANDTATQLYIPFNCSASNMQLTNLSLYLTDNHNTYFALNQTVDIEGSSYTATWNLHLGLGNYTWNCRASDASGYSSWASNRSIRISGTPDTTPPQFTSSFAPLTRYDNESLSSLVSATDPSGIGEYLVNDSRFSIDAEGGLLVNSSALLADTYYLNISVSDAFGNMNSSIFTLVVLSSFVPDTTPPSIDVISPDEGFETNASRVVFEFRATDASLLHCSLYRDAPGYAGYALVDTLTISPPSGPLSVARFDGSRFTEDLESKVHSWYINCTDASGNSAWTETRTLTVDMLPPQVTITTPVEGEAVGYRVHIITSVYDGLTSVSTTHYSITNATDTLVEGSLSPEDSWDTIWDSSGLGNVTYPVTFNMNAVDHVGNVFSTSYAFILDNINPSIQLLTPPRSMAYFNDSFNLEAVVQDFTLNYTNYSLARIMSNSTILDSGSQLFTWNDLVNASRIADGIYNLTFYAADDALNTRTVSTLFTLDLTPPNVTLISPDTHLRTNDTTIEFNWKAVDNIATSMYCSLVLDGNVKASDVLCLNDTDCSYTLHGLTWGDYIWNVTCLDNASNVNNPAGRDFIPDWSDKDNDGVHDYIDTLIGNESNVNFSGPALLQVTVNGSGNLTTFSGVQDVLFTEGSQKLVEFTHDFNQSSLDLNKVEIILIENSSESALLVNFSGQVQAEYNKTLYMVDNHFVRLCIKDAEVTSISSLSTSCTSPNEINFSDCLGSSSTHQGISCVETAGIIKISNLRHSAIWGTPGVASPSTPSSSGGSGGSSGGGCLTNYTCTAWGPCVDGIQTRTCVKTLEYCYNADLPVLSQACNGGMIPQSSPVINPPSTHPSPSSGPTLNQTQQAPAVPYQPASSPVADKLFFRYLLGFILALLLIWFFIFLTKRRKKRKEQAHPHHPLRHLSRHEFHRKLN